MKVAPVSAALSVHQHVRQTLVHTGQHYDANMSDVFFTQLGLPRPDVCLAVGSGSHAKQTAEVMVRFEEVVLKGQPDIVLVYGDVNSTVAATLVCAKLGIRVGHVEAGLRSFDTGMPEEINRLVTDRLADILFTPSADADANLIREGTSHDRIVLVGNVMIDTLIRLLPQARMPPIDALSDEYALVTLHRPSNVDDPRMLDAILRALLEISEHCQIVFPLHPRTRARIAATSVAFPRSDRFVTLDPLGYTEMLALQRSAKVIITDSGGLQEESTYLGVPCLTLRENTERPVTVDVGTNKLIGRDMECLRAEVNRVLGGAEKTGKIPALWDGKAGERIAASVVTAGCALPVIGKVAA
jgi:UDP-N-acetylglucosamine 2-epimerase (non-hydrolysing)